jgi:hypothetical protein
MKALGAVLLCMAIGGCADGGPTEPEKRAEPNVLSLNPYHSASVRVGERLMFEAVATFRTELSVTYFDTDVDWEVSNPEVVRLEPAEPGRTGHNTVTERVTVTGLAPGTATLTVRLKGDWERWAFGSSETRITVQP